MTDAEKIAMADLLINCWIDNTPSGPAVVVNGKRSLYAYDLVAKLLGVEAAVLLGRRG